MSAPDRSRGAAPLPDPRLLVGTEVAAIVVGLGAALHVALNPALVFAPAPRLVLFTLVSLVPALLLGSRAASALRLQLRGFVFTTAGAGAVCFMMIVALDHLASPEEKIAVFRVFDADLESVTLEPDGALQVWPTSGALEITSIREGNTLVAIFPEQVAECRIRVRYADDYYQGVITYTGSRQTTLIIGQELRPVRESGP